MTYFRVRELVKMLPPREPAETLSAWLAASR